MGLLGLPAAILLAPAPAGAANVGYYEMCDGQGSANQVASIVAAGHTPVLLTDLAAADLAGVDVIYVQNCDNDDFGAEYVSRLADIAAAVAAGKRLIIHDRHVNEEVVLLEGGPAGTATSRAGSTTTGRVRPLVYSAALILPGGAGISLFRNFDDDANIDILDNTTLVTNGPGGVLTNTSLDGGSSSSHGYAEAASLPAGARAILSRTAPNEVVTFSYPHGAGCVIYSTIPLDYYLAGNGPNPPRDNFTNIYAPNVVHYAATQCVSAAADPAPEANLIVNGNVFGEEVTVGNPVSLEFFLRQCGVGQELFLVMRAPAMGINVFSYLTMTGQWVPLPGDLSLITPFRLAPADGRHPLFMGTVPRGVYDIYFGCDFMKNGHLDYQFGHIDGAFDHVVVTVQ